MREARPISGRMARSLLGRAMGLQPKYLPPAGHSVINEDSGTPGGGPLSWVLSSGGVLATLDIDFVNDKTYRSSSLISIPSIVSGVPSLSYNTSGLLTDASHFNSYSAPLSLFSAAAGTYYVETDSVTGSGNDRIISGQSGAATAIFRNSDTSVGTYDGAVALTATIGSSGNLTSGVIKSAMAFNASSRSICAKGGTVASDANTFPTVTEMAFGGTSTSGSLIGRIRRIAYWNFKIADVVLQNLTT